MPVGVFTYTPNGRFAFPRSYVRRIAITHSVSDVELVGDLFLIHLDRSISYGIALQIYLPALAWNSNRYTLDHIIIDAWWFAFNDGVHHPDTCHVEYRTDTALRAPAIVITPSATGSFVTFLESGSRPSNYWLPPYLP